MTVATPAATVALLRDGDGGVEVLMLRRGQHGAFRGVWAFPGGRVDAEDVDPARPDDDLATARRAAARETAEETGMVVDPGHFVALSHWTPPPESPRRFDTWFFVAPAPAAAEVVVDGHEIHDHVWVAPADALARRDAGEIDLVPPTWVTLWTLAAAASGADAVEAARTREPERFATRMAKRSEGLVALWHGDAGYEDGDAERAGPRHRLSMSAAGWRYERSG